MADVFVRDRRLGQTERISVSSSGRQANGPSVKPAISPNGRYVTFDVACGTKLSALAAEVSLSRATR